MNGSLKLVVKLADNPGFKRYTSKSKVKAAKMHRDFLLETSTGFITGERGEYIVEASTFRFVCTEKIFLASYLPAANDDHN